MASVHYSADRVEKEYYKKQFGELSRSIRDYILNVFLAVFKDDYIGFIERYITKPDDNNPSTLAREFLVHDVQNMSADYQQLLLNRYNTLEELDSRIFKENSNTFVLNLFHQAINDCHNDADMIEAYCKKAILSSDVAASTKLITFLKPQDIPLFTNALGISGNLEPLKSRVKRIRNTRNKIDAHDSKITEISREKFKNLLNDMKFVLNTCTLNELLPLKEVTLNSIEECWNRIFYSPINLSSVREQVEDYTEEVLKDSRLNVYADYDIKKIYLCKMDEIKAVFHNLTSNSSLSKKLEASELRISELEGQVHVLEEKASLGAIPQTHEESQALSRLLRYHSGHLTNEQQQELWRETTVFVEAKAWLNREVRHFVAYQLIPALEKHGKKLYVDWPARVELFDLENQGNEEARVARMLMSDLHRRGKIAYLKQTDVFNSSLDYQLSIAEQNESRHFVLISEDRELYKTILSHNLSNVIPVAIIGEDLTVLKSSRILLNAFCVSAIKTVVETEPEDEKDNDDEGPVSEELLEEGTVYRQNGEKMILGEEIASGGEGTIFRTSIERTVAKIIHDDQLNATRIEKMEYMVNNNPGIYECAWPTELLYKDGKPVGFLMREVGSNFVEMSKSVLLLNRRSVQENLMKNWNRHTLVRLCIKLCNVFMLLHQKGILMGDINPNNILVNLNNTKHIKVAIVDCDSMQMGKFHCPVGMKAYTNPDIYVRLNTNEPRYDEFYRTMEDELYAFTSLIFRILMLNGSPYAGKGNQSIDEAMRSYNFSYKTEDNSGKDTPDGPYRMIWNNTKKELKDDFIAVFRDREYVSIDTLKEHLISYRQDIEEGSLTDELIPNKYYDNKNRDYTVDIVCEACHKPSNMPKRRYEPYIKNHMPLLCPNCNTLLEAQKYSPERVTMTCVNCSKSYEENLYETYLIQHKANGHEPYCPECRAKKATKVEVNCARCGKRTTKNQLELERLIARGKNPLCKECMEEIENRKKERKK